MFIDFGGFLLVVVLKELIIKIDNYVKYLLGRNIDRYVGYFNFDGLKLVGVGSLV